MTGSIVRDSLEEGSFNLRSINAIAVHIPFIEDARAKVSNEMEYMVVTGLTTLVGIVSLVVDRCAYGRSVEPIASRVFIANCI